VSFDDCKMYINGKAVFQRLILDQGFYPDSIYTAPTDDALRGDIELSMAMGFNGARLHQKMFESRFLYWADKLGYIVWGEHASWGLSLSNPNGLERFLPEWLETVERDYSHPSIIGWCPFNETGDQHTIQDDSILATVYAVTKQLDGTRPVIDTSGYLHVITDIYDVHDYDQNTETFAARYAGVKTDEDVHRNYPLRERYDGQSYFVSEYGGIWWNPEQKDNKAWGYGERPRTEEEFLKRYEGLTMALLNHPGMCAFCYTQLTDVEQEVNGLYTYDRKPKFDPAIIREINMRKAAIEE
jgi:beta-galactosidase/beta-glucuronidase